MAFVKSVLTDADIVRLVRLKCRAGVEALYDRYAVALLIAIIRIVPQKDIAEDILEQAFIKIWNSFDLYSPQKKKLFTWMIAIARSLAIEALSAKTSQKITA
jgi:RNA polymerase sigma-70 factor (ECF subfamily)